MKILGADLGGTSRKPTKTYVTILDMESGEIQRTSLPTTPECIIQLIKIHRPDRVVLEQTPNTGWVVDLLHALDVPHIQVVNPNDEAWKNRQSKTDRLDADLLVKLSVGGQVRLVHVPDTKVRQWRLLLTLRTQFVRQRTRAKNIIKATLRSQGIQTPESAWSAEGIAYLNSLSKSMGECAVDEIWKGILHSSINHYNDVTKSLKDATDRLDRIIKNCPMAKTLDDIQGVGPRAAEQIVSSIDDPLRFKNRRDIGKYFGVVPKVDQSGNTSIYGRITKAGNPDARAAITEVVQGAFRRETTWITDMVNKIKKGDKRRHNLAVQAVVRRIIVILWAKCRDYRRLNIKEPLLQPGA